MHIASGYHADPAAVETKGEGYVQESTTVGFSQGVKTRLTVAVPVIGQHEERIVEENLLRIGLAYPVPPLTP
nr:hypothetical protein [Geobacter sp.]